METAGLTRWGTLSALGLRPRRASSLHRAPVWRAGPSPFSSVAFGGRTWAGLGPPRRGGTLADNRTHPPSSGRRVRLCCPGLDRFP